MDDLHPEWLPALILFTDYKGHSKGQWPAYIDAVYSAYCEDFVNCRPRFQGQNVYSRFHPAYDDKGATFWHLVSEGKQEEERTPDFRRCERIRWPKPMIECGDRNKIKI